jgi:hypothetical protein
MSRSMELISEIIMDSFTGVLNLQQLEMGECDHLRLVAVSDGCSNSLVALLEFNGPELQGFFQLFLSEDCVDPIVLYDAGELVNQIAGRFSNRLYNCGFSIRMNPPRIVRSSVFEAQNSYRPGECG